MTPLQKLLKRLPKKYHDRVENIEPDIDLVDDCKYMLYFTEKYIDEDLYGKKPYMSKEATLQMGSE